MKRCIELLTLSSALLLTGIASASPARIEAPSARRLAEPAQTETVRKYIPMEDGGWIADGLGKYLANRNDYWWNEHRSFNALDRFYRGEVKEQEQGTLVSPAWNQSGDYVTFTLGGNGDNSFVGIYAAAANVGVDEPLVKITNQGWFQDSACGSNMVVRVVDASAFKGQDVKLAIVDRDDKHFGFLNFGALQVNQSVEEVAATIDLHKQILVTGPGAGTNNNDAGKQATLDYYARPEYAPYVASIGNIGRYDLHFENDGSRLELFGSDPRFEGGRQDLGFYYDLMVSDRSAYWWGEHMPFNKTGNRFLCTQNGLMLNNELENDSTWFGTPELHEVKMRFVTPLFTLGGSGYVSVKMSGPTAAIQILNEAGEVLYQGDNPSFITGDGALANVMESQVNMNTMVRTVVDASAFLGQKIRIGLVDKGAQDGVWSFPNFDELITYYESVPGFRADKISQTRREGEGDITFHGERLDYFLAAPNSAHPEGEEAYRFLFGTRDARHPIGDGGYFATARAFDKNVSFCSLGGAELRDLHSRYEALSLEAKRVVDASQDYQHLAGEGQAWFSVEADTSFTVGDSMRYIATRAGYLNSGSLFANYASVFEGKGFGVAVASVAALGLVAFASVLFYRKKKANR